MKRGVRCKLDPSPVRLAAPTYPSGLFAPGKGAFQHGAWFPQKRVRRQDGSITLSDDVLGPGFSLVGIGQDPSASIGRATATAWNELGGTIVAMDTKPAAGSRAIAAELLDTPFPSRAGSHPWCVVVRPDRTILHDGPAADADRIVRESMRLLGAPPMVAAGFPRRPSMIAAEPEVT